MSGFVDLPLPTDVVGMLVLTLPASICATVTNVVPGAITEAGAVPAAVAAVPAAAAAAAAVPAVSVVPASVASNSYNSNGHLVALGL